MATFKVKVKPLFSNFQKPYIDRLSKFYVIVELLLGLNRLPVLLKGKRYRFLLTSLACAYSLCLCVGIISCTFNFMGIGSSFLISWLTFTLEYTFCSILNFMTCKRLDRFYKNIDKFDIEIGCRPKTTTESYCNLILMSIVTGLISLFQSSLDLFVRPFSLLFTMPLITINTIHCLELSYHGHLLSLLTARLRLINYYMEISLSTENVSKRPDIKEFISFENKNKSNGGMKKLMHLYHILINSYDLLVDAIKWQLVVILITSFFRTLTLCYWNAMHFIRGEMSVLNVIISVGSVIQDLLPLFSPCMLADRVHKEVRTLRELIASRLCEKGLDKTGRGTARALLALTEARDLSFSLLRMLSIDVSLPFKFIGLLITYLIILVQFDKVIHPMPPNANT